MPQFHIDEVHKADETNVYIANFQNGYLNQKFGGAPVLSFENENGRKTFATQISDLVYSGEETEENLGKTLILVRNKSTGKVRLIETKNVELKPFVKSNLEIAQSQDNSYLELGRKFGSKKQRKALEQIEKLKLNDKSVSEQMQNVSKNISMDQLDMSTLNTSSSSTDLNYLPPCDRDSTRVENVYPPTCLLTEDQYTKVYQDLSMLDTSKLLPIIRQYINPDSSDQKKAIAVYAHSLLNMSMLSMKEVTVKTFDPCPFSETIRDHIWDNFYSINPTTKRRNRSLQYKDKAICHALVAMFLLTNFKFDLGDLAVATKLALKTVVTKVSLIGGQILRKDGKVFALLKLPLAKPKIARKSNK